MFFCKLAALHQLSEKRLHELGVQTEIYREESSEVFSASPRAK